MAIPFKRCGITGLAGILVTIWCGLRGWPKHVQRTVFQPVAVATFLMSALWIGVKGAITAVKLFLIGLPALFAGARSQAIRQAQRGCIPQNRAGASFGVRARADRLESRLDVAISCRPITTIMLTLPVDASKITETHHGNFICSAKRASNAAQFD
jgi:hypothetical protein